MLKKELKAKPKSELALHQAKQKGQVEVQARGPSQSASAAAAKLDNAEVGEYKVSEEHSRRRTCVLVFALRVRA